MKIVDTQIVTTPSDNITYTVCVLDKIKPTTSWHSIIIDDEIYTPVFFLGHSMTQEMHPNSNKLAVKGNYPELVGKRIVFK